MLRALTARSSFATRALARPIVAKFDTRGLKTSPALRNAAATNNDDLAPPSIIEKYGSLPFWGGLATIVITKEVFIIDAEFLLACEVGAFALAAYVMAGDSFEKYSQAEDDAKAKQFNQANDFALEMLNQYKMVQQVNQAKPEVLRQYVGQLKDATVAYAAYQTVVPQHAARKSVLAALEAIKVKEEHAASMAWQAEVDDIVAAVSEGVVNADAKTKQQMLDLAIANMGIEIKDSTPEQDPVKRLFLAQFPDEEA